MPSKALEAVIVPEEEDKALAVREIDEREYMR